MAVFERTFWCDGCGDEFPTSQRAITTIDGKQYHGLDEVDAAFEVASMRRGVSQQHPSVVARDEPSL